MPAERHLRHAIEIAGAVGDGGPVDLATGFLGEVLGWQGRHDEARAVIDEGIDRLEQQDASLVEPLRLELGILHLLAGEPAEAVEVFRTCAASPIVELLDHLGAQADLGLGAASLALGRVEEAVEAWRRAVDRPGVASPWVLAMGQALLGEAQRQAGLPAPLARSAAGLALATTAGFGTVQVEALELFAAESAGTGVDGAAFGAKLLGAARAARQQRALLPGVPGPLHQQGDVKSHVSHIFAKLSVTNRAELAAAWARRQ